MRRALLAVSLVACSHPSPPAHPIGDVKGLEARIKVLEDTNARYREALEFLDLVFTQQKAQKAAAEANSIDEDGVWAVDIADDVKAGQVDGPATASITIIKAFDFACPYCAGAASTMDELVKDHHGEVRVVYKNMVVHTAIAMPAHLASCAAAKQGKYLAFKTAFWDKAFKPYAEKRDSTQLGETNILAIAKDLKLDTKKLQVDMASEDCKVHVAADMAELEKFHVDSTPTFFVNGRIVNGAMPKEQFEQLIVAGLAEVKASGVAGGEYYAKIVMGKGEHAFRNKKTAKP